MTAAVGAGCDPVVVVTGAHRERVEAADAVEEPLATPSMADQVKRAEIWHINADEPRFLDWYDPDLVAPGPYRASDHDPVIVDLDLGPSRSGIH